jgi:hypothetical protein
MEIQTLMLSCSIIESNRRLWYYQYVWCVKLNKNIIHTFYLLLNDILHNFLVQQGQTRS